MRIVIDIDEKRFRDIQRISTVQLKKRTPTLEQVIANGILLPKGHGRLIDVDILDEVKEMITTDTGDYKYAVLMDNIRLMPTIIEADNEESEDKECR